MLITFLLYCSLTLLSRFLFVLNFFFICYIDFGIGGGIEHLPLDSGHGGGFGQGIGGGIGGGHLELAGGGGGHGGSGGGLEGSDYHHGVSVVSIGGGKPHNIDLTGGRKKIYSLIEIMFLF